MLAQLRQQFLTFWKKQPPARQITLASLLLAALILVPVMVNWANTPAYQVAYTGLSEADAAQIVQKMDENNIPYQLKSGGTIEVPADQVYPVRLLMAREGLPQSGIAGYELFSGSATLGMTEFSQKVNYQRAVEGELQRTIGSLEAVKAVRVHIVTPEKSLLSTQQALATASVTLQLNPGYPLNDLQVRSITHLVASSVEGLQPENVVVVDTEGNLLADGSGETGLAYNKGDEQRAAEAAYAADVQRRVQTLLDKILGPNRSTVQTAVEMDWTQRETTSNLYEPTQTALRSSQVILESSGTGDVTGGVPGAASNLPTPVATLPGASASAYQRSEETLNYEISQVQSHEVETPGKITRISVSVMVDGVQDPAQMQSIQAAVSAAAGIDQTRGDQVVVESFAFDRTALQALAAELEAQQLQELYLQIGAGVGAALLLFFLLFFILRMVNNLRNASKETWRTILRPVGEISADTQFYKEAAMRLQDDLSVALSRLADKGVSVPTTSAPLPGLQNAVEDVVVQIASKPQRNLAPEDEQRSRVISRMAEENPATVAEIIQIWLNEGKK